MEGEELYESCGVTLDEYVDSGDEETLQALRATFATIQKRHRGKVLLLKRTANNRRIPPLYAAFPECRTIVLWRDGRAVTASLLEVDWWLDHPIWWAGGKTPREMNLNRQESIEVAATNWVKEVEAIETGLARVKKRPIMQVHFEELLARPSETITSLLEFIGLDVTEDYLRQLQSLGLRQATERWRTFDDSGRDRADRTNRPLTSAEAILLLTRHSTATEMGGLGIGNGRYRLIATSAASFCKTLSHTNVVDDRRCADS